MILCSIEDERIFSALQYVKSIIQNKLEKNLESYLRIYVSHHMLKSFPYDKIIMLWKSLRKRRGVNQIDEKENDDNFIDHILNVSKDSNVHTNGVGSLMNIFQLP